MVFKLSKLWFNVRMFKEEAIALLGGNVQSAAHFVGVTCQAINKWPAVLPLRISDRGLGACLRNGLVVPGRHTVDRAPVSSASKAQAAIKTAAPATQAQAAINPEAQQSAKGVA